MSARQERAGDSRHAAAARIQEKVTPEVRVTTLVLEGPPTRRILEEAERWGSNLILIGSHGRGRLARLVLGSLSYAVVLHTYCSVNWCGRDTT